jgi:hypothetical protein
MTTKQQIILRDIIFKKLPGFETLEMQEAVLKLTELYPTCIDVENLIEHALAHKGAYDFVNEAARDFNDVNNSDSKSVSVNPKTRRAEILGVETKIGAIRITVFNPISPESTSFLYIPEAYLPLLARECYGQNAGKKRLMITWSPKRPKRYKDNKIGYFNMYERFRLDTFEDLATMTDEKFYQMNPHLRLNTSSPDSYSVPSPKIGPSVQNASLCTQGNDQSEMIN